MTLRFENFIDEVKNFLRAESFCLGLVNTLLDQSEVYHVVH